MGNADIDNGIYDVGFDQWWQPVSALYLLKTSINPVRVRYAREKLFTDLRISPLGKHALEIGCGGGILCEEIARMGFISTGIDPSEGSLGIARDHARVGGLPIRYVHGVGEALPFDDGSFDVAFCCDVLEHVTDLPRVASEISRVLRPGGIFLYDTVNRTLTSWLIAINISQKWKRWAFLPPGLHAWKKFVRPDEIQGLLRRNHLDWKEHRGTVPNVSYLTVLKYLRKRARGEWNYADLGQRLWLVESDRMSMMYMGYAVKG